MSGGVSPSGVFAIFPFHRSFGPAVVLMSLICAACSGPVETRSGIAGAPVPASATVAVFASPDQHDAASGSARDAVAKALTQYGYIVSDEGALRVTVGLGERPASLAVLAADGAVVSGAKRQKLLQECADRTQRLTLVAENSGGEVSRAWAEESHCKSGLDKAVEPLAMQAVARLVGRHGSGRDLRFGRD